MGTKEELVGEFARLRRGWGLDAGNLESRLGPGLTTLFEVAPGTDDRRVRDRILTEVRRLSSGFPQEFRDALRFGLGAEPGTQASSLTGRIALLSKTLRFSERTARRRVEDAFDRLAEEAAAQGEQPRDQAEDPDTGWHLRRLEALLRLDTSAPEVFERRTVMSQRDGLKQISARLSLPRNFDGGPEDLKLYAEVQYGAVIRAWERQGEAHFRYILELPRVLQRGDEHTYTLVFRTPVDQPIRPHFAFVPLVPCETFQLRVRFHQDRLPAAVWRFHRLAPRILNDRLVPGEPLKLDDANEVALEFTRLDQGYGYGIAWAGAAGR